MRNSIKVGVKALSKDFVYFEQIKDYLSKNVVYRFNNSGKPTICLFGNCHVAVIGDYLNEILSEAFDVVVILLSLIHISEPTRPY